MSRMKHMRSMKRGNWKYEPIPDPGDRTTDFDTSEEYPWDFDNQTAGESDTWDLITPEDQSDWDDED